MWVSNCSIRHRFRQANLMIQGVITLTYPQYLDTTLNGQPLLSEVKYLKKRKGKHDGSSEAIRRNIQGEGGARIPEEREDHRRTDKRLWHPSEPDRSPSGKDRLWRISLLCSVRNRQERGKSMKKNGTSS